MVNSNAAEEITLVALGGMELAANTQKASTLERAVLRIETAQAGQTDYGV